MTGRAIRSVAVLGGGIVGLSAATAFARALAGAAVAVIDTPPDPAALADRMPSTLPTVGRFHASVGVDEIDLVRRGIATHRLGTRFERWSADGEPWTHVYGDYGRPVGAIGFHDLWLRARRANAALPFDNYAAAAVLGKAERFVHPDDDPASPLSTFLYALQLDVPAYRAHLAEAAAAAGVAVATGTLVQIERREDGGVAALHLEDRRRVEADLFVDCAGPSAPLLSVLDPSFEDWSSWLPTDRLLLGEAAADDPPHPLDGAAATSVGWRWSIPLAGRRAFGMAYSQHNASESRARRVLTLEDAAPAAEPVAIRPGRRPRPWVRNVLAIGDAATAVDPLHGANLSLAHNAIERAVALLPGRDFHPLELAEYNRQSTQETGRVRDFLALHFLKSGRRKGEFWTGLAKRPLPDDLARTVEQFQARGRIPFFENEIFARQSWVAAMIGLGVLPILAQAMAGSVGEADAASAMEDLAAQLAGLAQRLPPYRDYLARMRRA